MTDNLETTFPYFVVWIDPGKESPCEGTSHARREEEARELAELRVIHGSFDSFATVYKGSANGRASRLSTYRWNGREVVFTG